MNKNSSVSDSSQVSRLRQELLSALSDKVQVPQFERNTTEHHGVENRIVHISVGQFYRSHQVLYLDKLLNSFPTNWASTGVGALSEDKNKIEGLQKQDCLYTLLERNSKQDVVRILGSMQEAIHAPTDTALVLERLADPATKILSLTITEKGYRCTEQGELDRDDMYTQLDLQNLSAPVTALGYIVSALHRRKSAGIAPFTVMSCDNLPGNGDLTRKLVLQFAELVSEELAQWIESAVSFPNAMVDRITPVTTAEVQSTIEDAYGIRDDFPVVCEDYIQWILEDDFCNGRPAWEKVGVQFVKDVKPYEEMKVRLLNGSHSALSYLAHLMGHIDVDKAMADPLIKNFVRLYMDQDITPTLSDVPGVNLEEYKDTLIERFSNTAVSDQVSRLALDGSQKIPNALVPCVLHQLETGGSVKYLSLAFAGWFRYLLGTDEHGKPIVVQDPLAEVLSSAIQADPSDPTAILSVETVFGTELCRSERFVAEVKAALESIHKNGVRETVMAYCE